MVLEYLCDESCVQRAEELSSKHRKLMGVFKSNLKKTAPKQTGIKTMFKRLKAKNEIRKALKDLKSEEQEEIKEVLLKKIPGRPRLNPKPRKPAPKRKPAEIPRPKKARTLLSFWKKN